jgi:chaperone BCS1
MNLAKAAFIAEEEAKITIKMTDENKDGEWRQVAQKHKRPLTSVVTEVGVKERLERDILEFCKSEEWYISRGVPWRRGFLLHGDSISLISDVSFLNMFLLLGVPGSGKTSLIHALASACDLDIYVVSLATKG